MAALLNRKSSSARALASERSGLLYLIERKAGITGSGLIVLAIAVVGWIIGKILGSRPMFVMVYALVLVVVFSWVLGRRKLTVDAHRTKLPSRVREGQLVEVEIGLTAKRRLSTIVLEEVLHKQLGTSVRVPVPLLPAGEEVSHPYSFAPKLRGVYAAGPLVAEWSDPFGLTKRRQLLAEPSEIIVHPATEAVHDRVSSREWEDPPVRPPLSKPWPTGFEFYGMREYVSGDDPRRIVWRASAKTYDPMLDDMRYLVRESEQGITDRVNLYLDTDGGFHSPGRPSETFETAVRAVASLGLKHLKDGFSVNLDGNGGRLAKGMRGQRDHLLFLDHLARVSLEPVPLERPLERLLTDPNRSAHNIIVTPDLSQKAAGRLRLLAQRGTSLLLAIVLWDDTDPATLHRAGTVGCSVVEIGPGVPLDRVFQRVIGMARR